MDEQATRRPWTRLDWKLVALLALLATGLRVWQLTHTEVAARDSIGFIRLAWQFHQADLSDWPRVLQKSEQHPLYPLWVLTVSRVLEPWHSGSLPTLMQHSAQLASTLAAILLVLPFYALGRQLFDRRVGFFCTLAVQCLPVTGCLLSDGLSEATFLLLASSSFYFGVIALDRSGRPLAFALTGLFGGLAYLTRPEGAVVVAATGVMLLAGQAVRAWRRHWGDVVKCGGALAATALLLAIPFIAATGRITNKPSVQRVGNDMVGESRPSVFTGVLLASWNNPWTTPPSERFWWGFHVLGAQIIKGMFYLGWAFVLLGLWQHGRRTHSQPGPWMMALVGLVVAYGLWRVAVVVGYLSDRHTLLILLCGLPWGVAGMVTAGEWLASRTRQLRFAPVLLPLACVLSGLPKVLGPLHDHRAGFRVVGLWLAEHTHPSDPITDPLRWAHYYAGRVFLEDTDNPPPPGHQKCEYVVLEDAGNRHPRVPEHLKALEKVKDRQPLHVWSVKRGNKTIKVCVYKLPSKA